MIVELGHFAAVLAFGLALLIALFGLSAGRGPFARGMASLTSLVVGQFVLTALAYALLTHAFLTDDFSVRYVAQHSNTLLPTVFKFTSVWGGHEGSFLVWVLIMTLWMLAVAARSAHLPATFRAQVLGVMGLMNVGFLAFLLFTSNPFERLVPFTPADGSDLNPLLQDFGMIVHPPMLYVGYVGFSVVFAFAIAALLSGRLDAAWARWSRPWTNAAWSFLTVGIALGSWWAYYELGWGGWWFWDPVENASFMPWLVGTALIHSLAATEKRGVFKSWTLLLAIAAFSLSLLGAFIVRSGVLTSVHAFAVDPERGLFILIFLCIVVGGSLLLYAARAWQLKSRATFDFTSRDFFVLLNNVIFSVALTAVLIGTLYPLAYEAVTGGKLSVGKPYFDITFVPLMLVLAAVLAVSPPLNWKRTRLPRIVQRLTASTVVALIAGVLVPLVVEKALPWQSVVAVGLAGWVVASHLQDLLLRLRAGTRPGVAYLGMLTAHIGFAVALTGVALTVALTEERDLAMRSGQTVEHGGWSVRFDGMQGVDGPNYKADQARFELRSEDRTLVLRPEKRHYPARDMVMTEAAIDAGFFADFYISLGDPIGDGSWAVRLHSKPFVRWIWLGSLLMALGGLLAVMDRRYRLRRAERETTPGTNDLRGAESSV